jgi:hypothetical protein
LHAQNPLGAPGADRRRHNSNRGATFGSE